MAPSIFIGNAILLEMKASDKGVGWQWHRVLVGVQLGFEWSSGALYFFKQNNMTFTSIFGLD